MLRPKGIPYFRLEVYKRIGISRVEVQKRAGKTTIRRLKGLTSDPFKGP